MTEFEQRLKDTLSTAYEIERELGGGGMSRVFVATDRILGRKIVIKVLSPELTAEVNRGRFRREMQVAAQLQHPHIVPLLSAGEQDDLLYFTMPFIKGESLKTAIEKDGRMSVAEVVRVLYHVSEALEYAHEAGIVHRDIKPANILRSGSYALITDFGVAKALNAAMPSGQAMTSTGMAIGTPAYMAPEQLAGDSEADHRIDIYAVGLLAYELLNGKSPFAGTTPQRILAAVLTEDPKPLIEAQPDVPKSLSDVVMRCLSKEPENRPATAKDLLNSLDVFWNSSGEIQTMEHMVARIVRTPTPTPTSEVTPVMLRDHTVSTREMAPTATVEPVAAETSTVGAYELAASEGGAVFTPDSPSEGIDYVGYHAPRKSRAGLYAGLVGVFALITVSGFLWSQRGGDRAPILTPADSAAFVGSMADSASLQSSAAAVIDSGAMAIVPTVDSQAIRDSLRRVARAEAAKKAAAKRDSLAKVQEAQQAQQSPASPVVKARNAASALFASETASKAFMKGATRMGGVLGTKRTGDLQTQIDALQPFLNDAGMSYEHFKILVQGAGISLFDEHGRMLPAALREFASGN